MVLIPATVTHLAARAPAGFASRPALNTFLVRAVGEQTY
jgi:hypothetical protein